MYAQNQRHIFKHFLTFNKPNAQRNNRVRWAWRTAYIEINWTVKFRPNISKLVYNDVFSLKIYKLENKLKI